VIHPPNDAPTRPQSPAPSPEGRLVHTVGRDLTASHGRHRLFRYVYAPETEARESPKPYLYPVRTLAGREVTIFRPHDHLWHHGIAMTWAQLWGGPTYVRDQGYVQLPNNGRQEHRDWEAILPQRLSERLAWVTAADETWIDERRTLSLGEVLPDEGCWALDVAMDLTNTRPAPLVFGSPTTEGRPLAGYGGLFWRGPRSFTGGTILAAGGLVGPDVMGQAAPWLAFVGRHDGDGAHSTLLFLDHPRNPRHPTRWFVRNTPYACASFAFAFDAELTLPPGETLALRYRIVVADGAWEADRADAYARRWRDASPSARAGAQTWSSRRTSLREPSS
jgi:hypothetical protein